MPQRVTLKIGIAFFGETCAKFHQGVKLQTCESFAPTLSVFAPAQVHSHQVWNFQKFLVKFSLVFSESITENKWTFHKDECNFALVLVKLSQVRSENFTKCWCNFDHVLVRISHGQVPKQVQITPVFNTFKGVAILAAQCEIPPPYRAIPFRDSIAEGGIAVPPICWPNPHWDRNHLKNLLAFLSRFLSALATHPLVSVCNTILKDDSV